MGDGGGEGTNTVGDGGGGGAEASGPFTWDRCTSSSSIGAREVVMFSRAFVAALRTSSLCCRDECEDDAARGRSANENLNAISATFFPRV